jgi:hypothetical protein
LRQAKKIWQILGKYKNKGFSKFLISKISSFSMAPQRLVQAFPNFFLAVLGDFKGLGRKKFGKASLSSF